MDESTSVTAPPDRVGRSERSARMAELLDAARGGSEDALGQITAELSPVLWHVARAAGLGADDAEDVVQTAWERLLSHLADIRVPQALVSWLVVTTKHEAWRLRSSGRRQRPADQEWLTAIPDEAAGAEEQIVLDEQQRALWRAVGRLSAQCQELLRIVAFIPRPDYQSVSAALGMPVGSIGPTRGRCLEKVRVLLADELDGRRA
ncbi:MAG TPA: sigma-70 family RNA polymerase sigma factor [Trebonia sp.]